MAETALMTEEAQLKIVPNVIADLRSINEIIRANTKWWMLDIFDGFRPHKSSSHAMKLRHDAKMSCTKEEGDSFYSNQVHDKRAEMSDTANNRECFPVLRSSMQVSKEVVGQCGLFQSCLCTLRTLKSEVQTNSLHACNLDPRAIVRFQEWINRIESSYQVGMQFECESVIDFYYLLPPY